APTTSTFTRSSIRGPTLTAYAQGVERFLAHERNVRICALLGAITIAFSSILVRLSHASPSTAAIFRCAYALPVLGFLAWLEDRRFGGRSWAERRTAVAYVGFLLLLRRGGADLRRPAGPLFDATATAAVLCVIAGVIIGDADLSPDWPGAGWLLTLALTSQVIGWLLITISLPRLPAALTALLLTVQPVGSVALAAVIFSESPSGVQLAGVALVLLALLVATAPRRRRSPFYAIAGASGSRPSAASMSSAENSGSS